MVVHPRTAKGRVAKQTMIEVFFVSCFICPFHSQTDRTGLSTFSTSVSERHVSISKLVVMRKRIKIEWEIPITNRLVATNNAFIFGMRRSNLEKSGVNTENKARRQTSEETQTSEDFHGGMFWRVLSGQVPAFRSLCSTEG